MQVTCGLWQAESTQALCQQGMFDWLKSSQEQQRADILNVSLALKVKVHSTFLFWRLCVETLNKKTNKPKNMCL